MASDRQFSWRRSVAWAVSLSVHLAVIMAMTLPREPELPEPIIDRAPVLSWVPVDAAVPAPVAPRAAPEDPPLAIAPRPALPRSPALPVRGEVVEVPAEAPTAIEAARPAPVARAVAYLDDEARALLPQETLHSATPPPREGDYFTPGDGSEDDVFYRPRALDPSPSRFAHAWRPRGNLIDDWLGRLMEKVSGKVSVPLNAKFSLVCGTVAGLAGSCTIVRNGGTGVIVQRPPPAPWDRSNRVQCRELRQALEDAEEAVQVAYYLDRLSALCSADAGPGDVAPSEASGNDEARHEAGLPEDADATEAARGDAQRAL